MENETSAVRETGPPGTPLAALVNRFNPSFLFHRCVSPASSPPSLLLSARRLRNSEVESQGDMISDFTSSAPSLSAALGSLSAVTPDRFQIPIRATSDLAGPARRARSRARAHDCGRSTVILGRGPCHSASQWASVSASEATR